MKSTTFALAAFFTSVAIAQPHRHQAFHNHHKRDGDAPYTVVTEVVYETEIVDVTATIWVSEGYVASTASSVEPASASTTPTKVAAQFFQPAPSSASPAETPVTSAISSAAAPPASTPSPAVVEAPAATSVAPSVAPVVPTPAAPSSSTPAVVAPVVSETPTSDVPIVAAAAPSSPAAVAAPAPASAPAASSSSGSSSGSSSSGGSTMSGTNAGSIFQFGDASAARTTLYTVGSCGLSTYFADSVSSSMPLVAMPGVVMKKYGASQHNSLCGKTITMTRDNGVTEKAIIADTNISDTDSIDMTSDVWTSFGQVDNDGSIIKSLTWTIS